jgi:hypothetical protein
MINTDYEIDELLATVAHATEEKLSSILYGYDRVQPGAQKILIAMLTRLRAPAGQRLHVHARRTAGPFELIIVQLPWKPLGTVDGFHPIIIGRDASHLRVVGYVLPFNDVMQLFNS